MEQTHLNSSIENNLKFDIQNDIQHVDKVTVRVIPLFDLRRQCVSDVTMKSHVGSAGDIFKGNSLPYDWPNSRTVFVTRLEKSKNGASSNEEVKCFDLSFVI